MDMEDPDVRKSQENMAGFNIIMIVYGGWNVQSFAVLLYFISIIIVYHLLSITVYSTTTSEKVRM